MADKDLLVWPEWAGVPLKTGYEYQPVDRRLRTDMEMSGVYRVEFDTDETLCTCNFIFNGDALAFFESFEQGLLNQGSRWFMFPLFIGGDMEYHKVRMSARPRIHQPFGKNYARVSLQLEIAKRDLMDPCLALDLLEYTPADVREAAKLLCSILDTMGGCTNYPADL